MPANKVVPLTTLIPPDLEKLLEPSALLPAEDSGKYMSMIAQIEKSVPALDFLTWLHIREIVEQRFEVDRCRKFKTLVIRESGYSAYMGKRARRDLGREFMRDNIATKLKEEEAALQRSGKTSEEIEVLKLAVRNEYASILADIRQEEAEDDKQKQSLDHVSVGLGMPSSWIARYEKIDRLLLVAERRYKESMQELENHVMGFGRSLRETVGQVIEGEFAETSKPSSQEGHGATNDRGRSEVALTNARSGSLGRPTAQPKVKRQSGGS